MANFSFIQITAVESWLKKHFNALFFGILLALVIGEIFVLQNSVSVILNPPQLEPVKAKGVHIDFKVYDAAVQQVNSNKDYQAVPNPVNNPFHTSVPTKTSP